MTKPKTAQKKTKKQKLAVFNWKMNPGSLKEAKALLRALQKNKSKMVVCPPDTFLYPLIMENKNRKISFGAQNASEKLLGSLTGEESASMSESVGAKYNIVGHSERRKYFADDDKRIALQIKAVLDTTLVPILCFGEKHRDPKGKYIAVLEDQLKTALTWVKKKDHGRIVFAYEPVWAIGKDAKRPITEEELFSTLILVRRILGEIIGPRKAAAATILYGGSVSDQNAESLVSVEGVDGFLVGRASLDPKKVSVISDVVS